MASRSDEKRLAAVENDLAIIRLDSPQVPAAVLEDIVALVGGDCLVSFRYYDTVDGLDVCDWQMVHLEAYHEAYYRAGLRASVGEAFWFGSRRPPHDQRNRVIESLAAATRARPGFFESSALYREFFRKVGLHRHRQLRALLFDGTTFLRWFGVMQLGEPTPRQYALLGRLLPALVRRFSASHALTERPSLDLLASALDAVTQPAMVLGSSGQIELANALARECIATSPQNTLEIARAASRGIDVAGVRRTAIEAAGFRGSLVTWTAGRDDRATASATEAARRWKLTPRQSEVLAHVVEGHANETIATFLGISVRAVEQHVTAIFDRVGVEGRTALVARVLAA